MYETAEAAIVDYGAHELRVRQAYESPWLWFPVPEGDRFEREIRDFLIRGEGRSTPSVSAADGFAAMRILAATYAIAQHTERAYIGGSLSGTVILCITPNPAIDRTLIVPGFRVGQVLRPKEMMVVAGVKGLNVARGIRILGGQAVCIGPLGGHTGRLFADLAQQEGPVGIWAWTEDETRTCTIIVNPEQGEATGIYDVGAPLSTQDWAQVVSDVLLTASRAEVITISGTLPSGLPPAPLRDMIGTLRTVNPTVWLDSSGETLAAAVAAQPTGLKINAEKAEGLLHRPVSDIHAACEAAQELHERGITMVVLTLGQLGAVLANGSGQLWAQPPMSHAINPVGSGDVFLAGLTIALTRGRMPGEALCHGVAAGSANARSTGGGRFTASDFEAVLQETVVQRLPGNDRPSL